MRARCRKSQRPDRESSIVRREQASGRVRALNPASCFPLSVEAQESVRRVQEELPETKKAVLLEEIKKGARDHGS